MSNIVERNRSAGTYAFISSFFAFSSEAHVDESYWRAGVDMVDCGVDGATVAVGHHWFMDDDNSMLPPNTWLLQPFFNVDFDESRLDGDGRSFRRTGGRKDGRSVGRIHGRKVGPTNE